MTSYNTHDQYTFYQEERGGGGGRGHWTVNCIDFINTLAYSLAQKERVLLLYFECVVPKVICLNLSINVFNLQKEEC